MILEVIGHTQIPFCRRNTSTLDLQELQRFYTRLLLHTKNY
jgi:hypothetical protein